MSQLSFEQRTIFLLRVIEEMSYEEITKIKIGRMEALLIEGKNEMTSRIYLPDDSNDEKLAYEFKFPKDVLLKKEVLKMIEVMFK